jgi:hypothetical protein
MKLESHERAILTQIHNRKRLALRYVMRGMTIMLSLQNDRGRNPIDAKS